ncbi:MAG: metallophosphoesterase [Oscillospiraceae bacterium]|nr:metallophosphoesterase [Oscillospiraceae bacterium]
MNHSSNQKSHNVISGILRRIGMWAVAALVCFVLILGANNHVEVTEYVYETNVIPFSFNNFKIVHLSDLHNKVFPENNTLLLEQIAEQKPNLIVLTGDFIDASNHTNVDDALLFMEQIPKIAPTYYVFGNHERLLDKSILPPYLEKLGEYGVHFLNNETVQIVSDTGQTFSLIGMDDNSLQANIMNTLAEESTDDFKIMLAHEPQFLKEYYAESHVNMVFSGHAHGGQFRIPFTHQGLYAPDQGVLPSLTEGVHTVQDTTMYISRGLGNSAFPFRLFNHPEIVTVTIKVTE